MRGNHRFDVVGVIPIVRVEIGHGVEALSFGEYPTHGSGRVAIVVMGRGQFDVDCVFRIVEERLRMAVGNQDVPAGIGLLQNAFVALPQNGRAFLIIGCHDSDFQHLNRHLLEPPDGPGRLGKRVDQGKLARKRPQARQLWRRSFFPDHGVIRTFQRDDALAQPVFELDRRGRDASIRVVEPPRPGRNFVAFKATKFVLPFRPRPIILRHVR